MHSSIRYYFTVLSALFILLIVPVREAGAQGDIPTADRLAVAKGENLRQLLSGLTGGANSCPVNQSVSPEGIYSMPPDSIIEDEEKVVHNYPPAPFPDMEIRNMQGDVAHLKASGDGKWLLVNIWATWCPPCLVEIPVLMELDKKLEFLDVAFLSLDFPMEAAIFRDKLAQVELPEGFSSYYTNEYQIWSSLGIAGVPTSLIIDAQGAVHYKILGDMDWLEQESLAFFDDLVKN